MEESHVRPILTYEGVVCNYDSFVPTRSFAESHERILTKFLIEEVAKVVSVRIGLIHAAKPLLKMKPIPNL